MNVFVLCTGRCGSTTLVEACKHISNYSAGHETRSNRFGDARLDYPLNHIEADNRLSWFLGRLGDRYGSAATYVHLIRNEEATARSYFRRWESGIMVAYHGGILQRLYQTGLSDADRLDICRDYCRTVNTNIRYFLRDKPRTMTFRLEHAHEDFLRLWSMIDAQGEQAYALDALSTRFNASTQDDNHQGPQGPERTVPQLRKQIQRREQQLIELRAGLEAANQRHTTSRNEREAILREERAKLQATRKDLQRAEAQIDELEESLKQFEMDMQLATARSTEQKRRLQMKNDWLVEVEQSQR